MKIETELGTFYVRFQHIRANQESVPPKMRRLLRDKTSCTIQDSAGKIIADGLAVTHPNDNYNKAKGRETALALALGGVFIKPTWNDPPKYRGHWDYSNSTFTRGFRRMVWQGYFARKSVAAAHHTLGAPKMSIEQALGFLA